MMKFKISFIFLIVLLFPSFLCAKEEKPFVILSSVMKTGQELPKKYSCEGANTNPPIEVYNFPKETKSWALTVQDLDAPEGEPWTLWIVYNISPDKISIYDNNIPGVQLLNDSGNYGYNGFCPIDDKTHRLVFKAYALDKILESNEGWIMKDLEKSMKGHILASSELQVTYRKAED